MAFQYPVEIPGVNNTYFLKAALNADPQAPRRRPSSTRWSSCALVQEKMKLLEIDRALLNRAGQRRASRAARRSATRSSRWRCSSRRSRSSTRPTPASTSTRCKIVADGVNALRSPDRAMHRRHPLPAAAQLHRARLRPRADRRPHRAVGRQGAGAGARGEGLRRLDRARGSDRPGRKVQRVDSRDRQRSTRMSRKPSVSPPRTVTAMPPGWRAFGGMPSIAFDARVPDDARRGLAVHERRADSRIAVRVGEARGRAPRPRTMFRSAGVATCAATAASMFVNAPLLGRSRRACRQAPSLAHRAIRTPLDRRRSRPRSPLTDDDMRSPRSTRRFSTRWRVHPGARADTVVEQSDPHLLFCHVGQAAADARASTAIADRRRPEAQANDRRDLRRSGRRSLLHQRRHRGRRRPRASWSITTRCSRSARALTTSPRSQVDHRPRSTQFLVALDLRSAARSCATTSTSLLDGEGARRTLNGLYIGERHAARRQPHDHRSRQAALPAATSSTRASSTARRAAVFNGKIIVRQDAQKTDAKQTNKALLLSDDATINTKPQLEIFADDVKCTHGATIGQLDDGMRSSTCASRGIGEDRGAEPADPRVRAATSSTGSRSSRCARRIERRARARDCRAWTA